MAGRLELTPQAARWLSRYEGEAVEVTITLVHARRSRAQNRRLWAGYRNALMQARDVWEKAGIPPPAKEELHDALKARSEVIRPTVIYLPNGDRLGEGRTTRTLSVEGFAEYMEEVTATFARGGIELF